MPAEVFSAIAIAWLKVTVDMPTLYGKLRRVCKSNVFYMTHWPQAV